MDTKFELDRSLNEHDPPTMKYVNNLLIDAIHQNAQSIYIYLLDEKINVDFKINGIIERYGIVPEDIQLGTISRFKVLSDMDIADTEGLQTGRMTLILPENNQVIQVIFDSVYIPSEPMGSIVCNRI